MAISFYHNHYGLLNRWAIRMGESPWFYNQYYQASVSHTRAQPRTRTWHQEDRENIAEALGEAYNRVTKLLGFYPQPTYTEDEYIQINRDPFTPSGIRLPKRKLIRIGKMSYSDPITPDKEDIERDYVKITLEGNRKIPGYFVAMNLPNITKNNVNTLSIDKLKGQYRFSIKDVSPSFATGITGRDIFSLTPMNPFIRARSALTEAPYNVAPYNTLSLPNGASNQYVYLFILPFWDMIDTSRRFAELQDGDLNNPLTYNNSDLVDNLWDSVELTEQKIDATNAIKLLFRPTSQNANSHAVERSVEATIIDYEKSTIVLKPPRQSLNLTNVYPNPFAIKISYESGYPHRQNGQMNPHIERAIIALANASVYQTLPVSKARDLYNEHRTPIYDSERRVKNPNFINPLGDKIGHVVTWDLITPIADRVLGEAYTLFTRFL